MNEQEAFEKLVAVVDFAIKKLDAFGVKETKTINDSIEILNKKIEMVSVLEQKIQVKNNLIQKLESKIQEGTLITTEKQYSEKEEE